MHLFDVARDLLHYGDKENQVHVVLSPAFTFSRQRRVRQAFAGTCRPSSLFPSADVQLRACTTPSLPTEVPDVALLNRGCVFNVQGALRAQALRVLLVRVEHRVTDSGVSLGNSLGPPRSRGFLGGQGRRAAGLQRAPGRRHSGDGRAQRPRMRSSHGDGRRHGI